MNLIQGYDRLLIDYKLTHCLNRCVFCHSGDEYMNATLVPFTKLQAITEKLISWKEANGLADFKMFITTGSWDHKDVAEAIKLEKRARNGTKGNGVMLGGMKHRSEPEMRKWLTTVKDAGAGWVGMTFWGPREMHDSWCGGRRGEYDFTMMSARLAAEIGLPRTESLFLTKSSLPHLNAVMDSLDAIPGPKTRSIFPLNYGGRAIGLEHERLTKQEFEALPARILKDLRNKDLRTEREWIEFVKYKWDERQIAKVMRMAVTKDNIGELESMSADEIMESLKLKHDLLYQSIPDFREMGAKYGDPANNKIYSLGDIEIRWSQCYYRENPRRDLPELKERLFLSLMKIIDYSKVIEAMKLFDEMDIQMFSLFPGRSVRALQVH